MNNTVLEVGETMANLDFDPVITALTTAVTPTQIITLIGGLIAFGIVYVFMWFGVRKVVKIFRNAVMKGKISV